jgi:hypothetical protein
MLELELSVAERRAILREHTATLAPRRARSAAPETAANNEQLLDALLSARAELFASGLDTTRIDAAIALHNGETP